MIKGGTTMVRKILEKVSDEMLQQDLEKYRQRALELGATDAKVIITDMILIDDRVRAKIQVPSDEVAGPEARDKKLYVSSTAKNHEIVSRIEAEAFFDGYHLALGFAGGSCQSVFCPDSECSALIPGQSCRHPLRARSSMEAVGMDALTMAAKVGWDVYPIGAAISPSEVPHGTKLGLVLIY